MDTDKVNTYLKEMIEFREFMINGLKYFNQEDAKVKEHEYKLETEIDLLDLLQEQMIAKGTYDVRVRYPDNNTYSSRGRCSYDD